MGITYVILFDIRDFNDIVGSLGRLRLSGTFAYVGRDSVGYRIKRHLSTNKKKRWHIDYLLRKGTFVKRIYLIKDAPEMEDPLAFELSKYFKYIPRFGASDSRAPSHLFFIDDSSLLDEVIKNFCKDRGLDLEIVMKNGYLIGDDEPGL